MWASRIADTLGALNTTPESNFDRSQVKNRPVFVTILDGWRPEARAAETLSSNALVPLSLRMAESL
jgi:hypothetical protein